MIKVYDFVDVNYSVFGGTSTTSQCLVINRNGNELTVRTYSFINGFIERTVNVSDVHSSWSD